MAYHLGAQTVSFGYDNAGNRTSRTRPLPKSTLDTTVVSEEEIKKELAEQEQKFGFESLAEGQVKVYPNPTEGAMMVKLQNISNAEGIQLQLYNLSGSLLKTKQMGSTLEEFSLYEYSSGVYILRVSRNDEKLEYKIIKK